MARPKKSTEADVPRETIVRPIVSDPSQPHVFEDFEKEGCLPEIKSIGFVRLGTTDKFVSYVITSKGDKVLRMDVAEPDMRIIAEEMTKLDFGNVFMDEDK